MHTHPSGRPATHIRPSIRHLLIVPKNSPAPSRMQAQDAWLNAKECQTLEDGTSARIEPAKLARMDAMECGKPLCTSDALDIPEIHRRHIQRRNNLCKTFGDSTPGAGAKTL